MYDTTPKQKINYLPVLCFWPQMDGTWYLSAVATDLLIQGECAMVIFDHQNTLDVSIKWITNHTASYYNGSVALIPDPKSNTTGDLLQVTYDGKLLWFLSYTTNKEDLYIWHYGLQFAQTPLLELRDN